MIRCLSCSTLCMAVLTSAGIAQDGPDLASPDYFAPESAPYDPNCPDGNCPEMYSGAHGHGLHSFGKHGKHGHGGGHGRDGYGLFGKRAYPPHWGLAYASGYPNGVNNYGNPPYIRDYKGRGLGCRTCSNGECRYRFYGQPDLFYNYYAWPSCTGLGAELYVSPRPVPPHVGHTFITYQPLMPHEFLYSHHRTYHRYYNGGQGLSRTHVHYFHSLLPWK